jgi:hypothetical protein
VNKDAVISILRSEEEFQNWRVYERYQDILVPLMEGAVRFAKQIPGFSDFIHLQIKDKNKITLP